MLTLLSAIFGGALRLVPELLKWLGQKDQNAHELAMQDKQLAFLQVQGKLKTDEINAQGAIDMSKSQIDAIVAVNQQQMQEATGAGWFVCAINALVRPLVTFYIFALWGAHELATMLYAYRATGDAMDALQNAWTVNDQNLLAMIAAFYFVGRTWDKNDTPSR